MSAANPEPAAPPRKPWVIASLLVLVFAQVVAMAWLTSFDVHPDEDFHILTAQYYNDNWLPPPATDPVAVDYLHPRYGTSYLLASPPQILYPLSAKTALVTGGRAHFARGLRFFNIALLFVLVCVCAVLAARNRLPAFFLLLTPQVWYVFSYYNSAAFPFFLAFLLALMIGWPHSRFRAYLENTSPKANALYAVPPAICMGLLLLAKHNYLVFVLGAATFALVLAWGRGSAERGVRLRRWLLVVILAGLIPLPLVIRDGVINDFDKEAVKAQLREEHAVPNYKPSRIHEPEAAPKLALRAKGVGIDEVLGPMEWPRKISRSFTGVYGPLTIFGPSAYYVVQLILYVLLAVAAGVFLFRNRTREERLLAVLAVGFIGWILLDALLFSWIYDFQAQGRYLFPAIPMLLMALLTLGEDRRVRLPVALLVGLFALGTWSFVFVGMKNLIP